MLLAPVANYAFLRYVGGDGQNEKSQEERYEERDLKKAKDLKSYKMEKNSFWPRVEELKNEWTWIVVGAGVAGVVGEWGVRKFL